MCESRAVPSGRVYGQLFDAQVQLSRSLLAGRGGLKTARLSACLSAEDSTDTRQTVNRHTNITTSELLSAVCLSSSRGQQVAADVRGLPDAVVIDRPSSDIIERLRENKQRDQRKALDQLYSDLAVLSKNYETRYRSASMDLLSSLQEHDHRLDLLMDRLEGLECLEQFTIQEVYTLWEEVVEVVKLRRRRIRELDHNLTGHETERASMISVLLRKCCHLLEKIGFLQPSDVHRLIHTKAMMINQALLANHRSVACLLLRLLEDNLEKESLLRLGCEDFLSSWRRSQVNHVIDRFREFTSSELVQKPASVQQTILEMRRTQQDLSEHRRHIILQLCSLVPPTCSTALVFDWHNQLTAVNHKIDCLHVDSMHRLRCCYEQTWQDCLAEVERCREVLSALELPEEEVQDIVSSQLLTLTGQCQSHSEDQLAALDGCFDSMASHAVGLCRSVFVLLRGLVLLWETHHRTIETREVELQHHLDDLRHAQEQEVQKRKVHLDILLDGLRQESSEEALKSSLDNTVLHLEEIKECSRQWTSGYCEVLDSYPALLLEELHTYSNKLSRYYHINNTYTLSPEELHTLYPSINLELIGKAEMNKQQEISEKHPINSEKNDPDTALALQDWLTEAESSLVDLCDSGYTVTFISSRGRAYSGPAFICQAPEPLDSLEQETKLTLFPAELLTQTLTRMRVLFFDHLEQHFHDVLRSTFAMVADLKEALRSEQELQLLDPQLIQIHIHNTRTAELVSHRERVEGHCQVVLDGLTSCRSHLLQFQSSISRKNQEFTTSFNAFLHANTTHRLNYTFQDCHDQHVEEIRCIQMAFRHSLSSKLDELRRSTTAVLHSFRLFSEGGDYAPQEVEVFQKRLETQIRLVDETEDNIQADMEVKDFEEEFSFLKAELSFLEKSQKILSNIQLHIKTEAAKSNQQQKVISGRLEELKRMKDTEVSPKEVSSFLSSLSEELRMRCQYLDCFLDPSLAVHVPQRPLQGSFALAALSKSRKQERLGPPPGLLQPCRKGVAFFDDVVVDVVKALNNWSRIRDVAPESAEREQRGTSASPGQSKTTDSPSPQPRRHKSTESVRGQRRVCRPTRTDRRFQVFGSKPEAQQNTKSFRSSLNNVLWKTNEVLSVAEDFYRKERRGKFRFLPDSFDQYAESLTQKMLGYQEQTNQFHSTSIQEFVDQLCVLEEVVCSLLGVLFGNHGRLKEAELMEEVGGVRQRLDAILAASEEKKRLHVSQLRVGLSQPSCQEELEALRRREEERQQELHSAIDRLQQEMQDCVYVREGEFVTSLASLTESLLFQLDNLLTPGETEAPSDQPVPQTEHCLVTMGTGQPSRGSRMWPGIPYLSRPTVGMETTTSSGTVTTASITTAKCTLGHLAVIEQRDAALKRYEELYKSELLRSDGDRNRRLAELQTWRTHWNLQADSLTIDPFIN